MAASKLDICNLALGHLRQAPVSDLSELSPEGEACRTYYDQALETALRTIDWPFARTVVAATLAGQNPMPGWLYAYASPEDCLTVQRLIREPDDEAAVPYVLMRYQGARAIFTNQPAAGLVYTARVDDTASYPADFVHFLSLHLAAMLAMPLTGKADMATILRKQVEEAGQRAVQAATQEDFNSDSQGAYAERDVPPPAASAIEIANLALGHLGAPAIKSFGERSRQADAARRFYRQAVDTTLRALDWPFARRFEAAAPIGASTVPGYRLAFAYPADALAIREIARADRFAPSVRYQIARSGDARVIVTDAAAPVLRYTCRPADEDDFDPEFIAVAALQLAVMLCMPVMGKPDLLRALSSMLAAATARAEADAANEDSNDLGEDPVPDWLAVRGVASMARADRVRAWASGAAGGLPAVTYLPNESGAPAAGMLGAAPSKIEAPYIPGLTAPPEPALPILGSSDFSVFVDGGAEGNAELLVHIDGGEEGTP